MVWVNPNLLFWWPTWATTGIAIRWLCLYSFPDTTVRLFCICINNISHFLYKLLQVKVMENIYFSALFLLEVSMHQLNKVASLRGWRVLQRHGKEIEKNIWSRSLSMQKRKYLGSALYGWIYSHCMDPMLSNKSYYSTIQNIFFF